MTEKIKIWKSGVWLCVLVNDGVASATVSLTDDETAALAVELSSLRTLSTDGKAGAMEAAFNEAIEILQAIPLSESGVKPASPGYVEAVVIGKAIQAIRDRSATVIERHTRGVK